MSDNRWQRVEEIFHQAADLSPAERAAFLDRECAGDDLLREEVESLLRQDAQGSTFFQAAVAAAAEEVSEDRIHDDLPGRHVGPYLVERLIGKGGMGAVYLAVRDDQFKMQVAVKVLKRGTDTATALGRFRAERQILAQLQHPNIARLLDGGATDSGLPYFVMEYIDGRPLVEFAAALPVRKRLELFLHVCAAVQYAHQNLVVHRDIKPGNILVTADGTPKLLDFGIAKLLDPAAAGTDATFTALGLRPMTPSYASPEQVRGEPVSTGTDVYSLGAVLYELLTGERLFRIESYTPEAIEKAVCTEVPRKPSFLATRLDSDLDNIVLMALRKEPSRRYASVEQFAADIRRYLEGRPVLARKDTLAYRCRKFVVRNRIALALAGLAAAGIITGVVAVNVQARRAEARFQQVRKLANTVVFDLYNQIEFLTGSTSARELLVKTSLEYLDSLAAETGGDPALQLELVIAYERIGDIQGNPFGANLGHPEAALASYRKALALAERVPPSFIGLWRKTRCQFKIGNVLAGPLGRTAEATQSIEAAVRTVETIPALGGNPLYRGRAETYGWLGRIYSAASPSRAIEPYRRSLELAEKAVATEKGIDDELYCFRANGQLGEALWYTGDLAGAMRNFEAAAHRINALLAAEPGNDRYRREVGIIEERIALVSGHPQYPNLGDTRTAAALVGKNLAFTERLVASDPKDVRARSDLSIGLSELAAILRDTEPRRAEGLYRRSLELGNALLAERPGNVAQIQNQMFSRVGFAWVLRRLGQRPEAIQELDRAVRELQTAAAKDSADASLRLDLGIATTDRAEHLAGVGRWEAAAMDLGASRELLEALYSADPRTVMRVAALSRCYELLGDLQAGRGAREQARAWRRKNLELWDRWRQGGVSSGYDQRLHERARRLLAGTPEGAPRQSPAAR